MAATPKALAQAADITFAMLADPAAAVAVALGKDGIVEGACAHTHTHTHTHAETHKSTHTHTHTHAHVPLLVVGRITRAYMCIIMCADAYVFVCVCVYDTCLHGQGQQEH